MRFYHTFWTKPMSDDRIAATLVSFAASFAYAKRLGGEVVLHTDTAGAEILSAIPYDEVILDLDGIEDRITRYWAYGKLVATQNEPLESIHIDGDVFLTSQAIIPMLNETPDLLIQSEEDASWRFDQSYQMSQIAVGQANLPDGLHILHPSAYNCGFVKFSNAILKEKYLNAYFSIVDSSLNDPQFVSRCESFAGNRKGTVIPDLIAEQQVLHELAQGYQVKVLLEPPIDPSAERIGYIHLLGRAKIEHWEVVAEMLRDTNYALYEDIINSTTFRFYKQLMA